MTDVTDRTGKKYNGYNGNNKGLLSSESRTVMSKVLSIKRGVGQRIVITALQVCPLCCKSRAVISKVLSFRRAVGQSLALQNQHTRELISAGKTSHKQNNKDLSRLR